MGSTYLDLSINAIVLQTDEATCPQNRVARTLEMGSLIPVPTDQKSAVATATDFPDFRKETSISLASNGAC